MTGGECELRFYAELNDFLPPARRGRAFRRRFDGTPAVKDTIESLGVPHTEVDLILVNGVPVRFSHRLRGGERIAVYPVFERLDITPVVRLRPAPLRVMRFVADVHLGKLARRLRLLGFDTLYQNDFDDSELIRRSVGERRILLTRDVALLKHKSLTHACYIHATDPARQLEELVAALDLRSRMRPFTRCMRCNGRLRRVPAARVAALLPARVRRTARRVARCAGCGRLYWRGSHLEALSRIVGSAGKS
jgi:uncharacterized protein with PIN domain